jgi:hypothetical protein
MMLLFIYFLKVPLFLLSIVRAKVNRKPGHEACSGALPLAILTTGAPSLSDTTIAWSPSTLGNFLHKNHFRSSAMMNPFLSQNQSTTLGVLGCCNISAALHLQLQR